MQGNEEVHEGFTHKECDEEKQGQGKGSKKKAFISKETTFRRKADVRVNVPANAHQLSHPFTPRYVAHTFGESSKNVVN